MAAFENSSSPEVVEGIVRLAAHPDPPHEPERGALLRQSAHHRYAERCSALRSGFNARTFRVILSPEEREQPPIAVAVRVHECHLPFLDGLQETAANEERALLTACICRMFSLSPRERAGVRGKVAHTTHHPKRSDPGSRLEHPSGLEPFLRIKLPALPEVADFLVVASVATVASHPAAAGTLALKPSKPLNHCQAARSPTSRTSVKP